MPSFKALILALALPLAACGGGGGSGGGAGTGVVDSGPVEFSATQTFGIYTLRCASVSEQSACLSPTIYDSDGALIGPLSGFGTIGVDGKLDTLGYAGTRLCQAAFGLGYAADTTLSSMETVTPQPTLTVVYLTHDDTWATLTVAEPVNVFTALACTGAASSAAAE